MTWWDLRQYAPLGKTVLSGLLSVTTVGLLTPQSIPRAWVIGSAADEPVADDMPQVDDDDTWNLLWEGAPLLGGEELVSGTREHAACYQSGELHVAWRGADVAGEYRVSLGLDEESFDLVAAERTGEQGVYEACFVLEDGLYHRLALHVEDAGGNMLESTFEHVLVTTRQPRYRALWDMAGDGSVVDGTTYYSEHRTLTISVEDPCPGDDLSIVANGERLVAHARDPSRAALEPRRVEEAELANRVAARRCGLLHLDGMQCAPLFDDQVYLALVPVAVVREVGASGAVSEAPDELHDHVVLEEAPARRPRHEHIGARRRLSSLLEYGSNR